MVKATLNEVVALHAMDRQTLIDCVWWEIKQAYPKGDAPNPDVFIAINMDVCGSKVEYATEYDVPYKSAPCSCGNPRHWFIKYDEAG